MRSYPAHHVHERARCSQTLPRSSGRGSAARDRAPFRAPHGDVPLDLDRAAPFTIRKPRTRQLPTPRESRPGRRGGTNAPRGELARRLAAPRERAGDTATGSPRGPRGADRARHPRDLPREEAWRARWSRRPWKRTREGEPDLVLAMVARRTPRRTRPAILPALRTLPHGATPLQEESSAPRACDAVAGAGRPAVRPAPWSMEIHRVGGAFVHTARRPSASA